MTDIDLLSYENQLWSEGKQFIAGIDEAGRGPLAGPVVAAAVVLNQDNIPEGINDSKKLSSSKREYLFAEIKDSCLSYGIGKVWQDEIDKSDILRSTHKAMRMAIGSLNGTPDYLLVDGRGLPEKIIPQKAIVSGDSLSASIAAASIMAKVTRDRIMLEVAKIYPEYEFEKHKGYGTANHIRIIENIGSSPIHRHSFRRVKGIKIKLDTSNKKEIGNYGERLAALELIKEGYKILERNYWADRENELDIIAGKNDTIVFVEVKTKMHGDFGEPETWITENKKNQIASAANYYINTNNPDAGEYRFDVMALNINSKTPLINHITDAFRL